VKKNPSILPGQRRFFLEEVGWLRKIGRYEDALTTGKAVGL